MFGGSLVSSFLQTRDRSTMVSMNGLNLWYQLLPSRTSAQSGFLSVLTRNMDQWNASECSGLTKNRKTFLKVDAAGAPPDSLFHPASLPPFSSCECWLLTTHRSPFSEEWPLVNGCRLTWKVTSYPIPGQQVEYIELNLCLKIASCDVIHVLGSSGDQADTRLQLKHCLAQLLSLPCPASLAPSESSSSVNCVQPNRCLRLYFQILWPKTSAFQLSY